MNADWPVCPHCGVQILMDDPEVYEQHTTYWGDREAREHTCSCGVTIYLKEHVRRWWEAGRTPQEAAEL